MFPLLGCASHAVVDVVLHRRCAPIFFILAAVIALAGCASGYRFSAAAENYRSSLNESQALTAVHEYVKRADDQAGLCSALTNAPYPRPAKLLTVKDALLMFEGTFETRGEQFKGIFRVNLRDLVRIRVLDDYGAAGCPVYSPKGYMVMIDDRGIGNVSEGRANAAIIHVSGKNLDNLMAALSKLSPNAHLMRGVGM